MFGNGLRAQIWEKFTNRFNIPNIAEFYGATEGNSNIVNIENKIGAVGFCPVALPKFLVERLLPLAVIKVDKETGEPIRNEQGFCIEAETGTDYIYHACSFSPILFFLGERGEFIGKIVRGDPVKDFVGYKDKNATKKKVLENVFSKGDIYFRSGDILMRDELGWLYFKDRAGDTFRFPIFFIYFNNKGIIL